jgi:hypothetical protein
MLKKLINQTLMPQVLDNGTVLAAAGKPGSTKEVESIADADRARLVTPGHVLVIDLKREEATAVSPAPTTAEPKSGSKGGGK